MRHEYDTGRGIAYPLCGMSTAPLWPDDDVSRVPYRVYRDPGIHTREQERIFRGPTWNFLCLEAEIPEPGDYKTCFIGDAPIIAVRDAGGGINALVNRCAHKGALLCYKPRGRVSEFTCVYHNWTYDLAGRLTGVAFGRGVRGEGGMEAGFEPEAHGLHRLRTASRSGLVFATFSGDVADLATYIGPAMLAALDRVLVKPVRVLGYHSQLLPNNWKLYAENTKDSYHATLLHVFHNTFGIVRFTMGGGIVLSENGWHHLSFTERTADGSEREGAEAVRSLKSQYALEDPSLMEHWLELGDRITNSIQTIFPTLVVQQILNALAVRQLVPRGPEECELRWTVLGFEDDDEPLEALRLKVNNLVGPAGYVSMEDGCIGGFIDSATRSAPDERSFMRMGGTAIEPAGASRVTEAAVRGFWRAWRDCMAL